MNVLLISQCSKNALTETRRILDQFAERRGDRTWQTAITQQGLETLHRLLRQTARKNTAVACHWIRGKDHSELLWIVGNARQFNAQGATPTNMTARDVLRADDENDWHTAEDIRLLARMAALFHDFGKANNAFQNKLISKVPKADAYRHEWVSLRLFESFVKSCGSSDKDWLTCLLNLPETVRETCISGSLRDGLQSRVLAPPFRDLPPLARIVGWLIVSHHRLPTPPTPDTRLNQRLF
ncbi:MAG: HD domain-containing protein, partial [Candidatus Competibacter denitrificans]